LVEHKATDASDGPPLHVLVSEAELTYDPLKRHANVVGFRKAQKEKEAEEFYNRAQQAGPDSKESMRYMFQSSMAALGAGKVDTAKERLQTSAAKSPTMNLTRAAESSTKMATLVVQQNLQKTVANKWLSKIKRNREGDDTEAGANVGENGSVSASEDGLVSPSVKLTAPSIKLPALRAEPVDELHDIESEDPNQPEAVTQIPEKDTIGFEADGEQSDTSPSLADLSPRLHNMRLSSKNKGRFSMVAAAISAKGSFISPGKAASEKSPVLPPLTELPGPMDESKDNGSARQAEPTGAGGPSSKKSPWSAVQNAFSPGGAGSLSPLQPLSMSEKGGLSPLSLASPLRTGGLPALSIATAGTPAPSADVAAAWRTPVGAAPLHGSPRSTINRFNKPRVLERTPSPGPPSVAGAATDPAGNLKKHGFSGRNIMQRLSQSGNTHIAMRASFIAPNKSSKTVLSSSSSSDSSSSTSDSGSSSSSSTASFGKAAVAMKAGAKFMALRKKPVSSSSSSSSSGSDSSSSSGGESGSGDSK
jgi:hypothetical protein